MSAMERARRAGQERTISAQLRVIRSRIRDRLRAAARRYDRHILLLTFAELGIDQDMVDALAGHGILEPFPIQAQTIPLGLSGQDIIGQAKTGTGKTLGFGLPIIQRLGHDPKPGVQVLVVVPTRELCVQVAEDLEHGHGRTARPRSPRSTAARRTRARSRR